MMAPPGVGSYTSKTRSLGGSEAKHHPGQGSPY